MARRKPRAGKPPAAPASPVIAAVYAAAQALRESHYTPHSVAAARTAATTIAQHLRGSEPIAPWYRQQSEASKRWDHQEACYSPLPSSGLPETFPFI